ncbi:MAG TPA: penicillin-binding transpeptidase domain-containing protein, partial [Candidatus Berkiella sp.]|nr:penicillin-binding transpeptidase domain-containing protein [Candidatus Berkiella sp.]
NKPAVYIASRDFYAEDDNGFVDYISAFRSPGSTLKPFIFGLGFDLGLLKPDSYLLDERRRFGAYYPRNFDKDIHGMITAEEALAMSLNIPVVALLNQIGVVRFLSLLKEAGVTPQIP